VWKLEEDVLFVLVSLESSFGHFSGVPSWHARRGHWQKLWWRLWIYRVVNDCMKAMSFVATHFLSHSLGVTLHVRLKATNLCRFTIDLCKPFWVRLRQTSGVVTALVLQSVLTALPVVCWWMGMWQIAAQWYITSCSLSVRMDLLGAPTHVLHCRPGDKTPQEHYCNRDRAAFHGIPGWRALSLVTLSEFFFHFQEGCVKST
jgi:hypothetical protein